MLKGSYVALVTPFTKDDKLNEKELERLVEFQINNGTNGLVPVGTTGESPTLSWEEHHRVIEIVSQINNKRVDVIAGTGSNNTKEAIDATVNAQKVGADYALVVCPYYNKPTQEGLFQHFKAVAENTDIGIIIYNIPGRVSVNMLPETVERLAEIPNIIGIKEATGDLNQMSDVLNRTEGKLALLSGDDTLTLPVLSIGGSGVVSVLANIVPDKVANMINLYNNKEFDAALSIHHELFKLGRAMFVETNPIPIKAAMEELGWAVGKPRLPLTEITKSSREYLRAVLKKAGLL